MDDQYFMQPARALSPAEVDELTHTDADEQTTKLGRKVWQLALKGNNKDAISQKLKISMEILDDSLAAYRAKLGMSIDYYRGLDNAHIDELVSNWLPVATAGPVLLQKIKGKEVVIEEDFDRPIKAAYLVLHSLQARGRILGATQTLGGGETPAGGLEGAKSYTERQVVIWLREVFPSIERITREIEAEVIQPTNGNSNPTPQ